jgi:phosphoribosylanthranilate isomerase
MTKVKICGLTRLEDIKAVNEVLPDYVGFVFANSRRKVGLETAIELKKNLNSSIKAVGVFVNEEPENIIRFCKEQVIDVIQLHGDEKEEYILKLKQYLGNDIIKAVRVKEAADINKEARLPCDYILLDTYREGQYGGSGTVFNWNLISNVSKPFFLAGGIYSGNVLQAVKQCNPYCIDVSSGVETDHFKDLGKIRDLIQKIRRT